MINFIPYFAGFVTLMFGIAFYLALQEFKQIEGKPKKKND